MLNLLLNLLETIIMRRRRMVGLSRSFWNVLKINKGYMELMEDDGRKSQ